nr:cytochrome c oxidase subunit II [Chroodactylon ornatum]
MFALCDAPRALQVGFQDPSSPLCAALIALHHEIAYILLFVLSLVSYMLIRLLLSGASSLSTTGLTKPVYFNEHTLLELLWTLLPSMALLLIALPSFSLLYGIDHIGMPALTVKAIGNQWYWAYEYADLAALNGNVAVPALQLDSYMLPSDALALGDLRLLEADTALVIPTLCHIRLLVSSADVLHSFAMPSMAVKCDAIPGRINQAALYALRAGIFYGQCSEICGLQHGFMPIVLESSHVAEFRSWCASLSLLT